MLAFLVACACALRPLVVMPPLYGTNLFVNYSNADLHWYCPESAVNELLWVSPKYLVPPMHNCLLNLMTVHWDDEKGDYSALPNVTVFTDEIGRDDSVRYVDGGILGYRFVESFETLINRFHGEGWKTGQDIFAAPYDWRLAPTGLGKFWDNLKAMIEHAYEINGQTKVTMFGYSCGGFMTQQFLSKHVTQEWKDKYMDRVVFLGPSFAGVGGSFPSLWMKRFPLVPFVQSDDMIELIQSMPVIMSHLPNVHVYGDTEIVRSYQDHTYTAKDLASLLLKHNKIVGESRKIFDKASTVTQEVPEGPGIPTYLIFNSGVDTQFKFHFKKGWDKPPKEIFVEGDGTIPSKGLDWACHNWSVERAPLICLDTYRDDSNFEHTPLSANPYIIEKLLELLTTDDWTKTKGRKIIRAPYVVVHNNTYTERTDIRGEKVLYESED